MHRVSNRGIDMKSLKLLLHFITVGGLVLLLLIPLMMIRGTIQERQQYRDEAVRKVGASFGGRQVIGGPVLVVPYEEQVEEDVTGDDGIVRKVVRRKSSQWTFFPDSLAIDGELKPDTRKVGLHLVRVYEWNGDAAATFDVQVPADEGATRRSIGRPWLSFGIADVGGLRGATRFTVDGAAAKVEQGIGHADGPGIHVRMAAPQAGARLRFDARVGLQLQGTETFAMMPYGASNELRVKSSWPHPKFDGKSPQQDIDGKGFRAHWQVAAVATNAQRRYLQQPSLAAEPGAAKGAGWAPSVDSVSVSLIDPVNPYVQADRENSYCGVINIYNFLSDSFKFNRNADEGYLIGRIFINRERRYFVEGKQQTSMRAAEFGKSEIGHDALIAILEEAIWFALNFDLLMPPYEDNKRVTVDQFNTKMDNSKFVTGKRLGYVFEVEDI